ncbi:hypothetical protein [Acidithiobacillus ferriphilus]|uniref:Uncharacterized protein n=1 Tax=Acidithiobacillus ferriphilus TaxID=1689834 RepID=A0ABU6FSU4_9PROT|nr:hypothetical protein [Acidithiobacillus ferriphilus]MEB8515134.1 hypothetical protein [Acidithiobacillus ferriphilus]
MSYTVAIYLVDLAYGGPEEGGWYYECGEPAPEFAAKTRGFARENDAHRYCKKLNGSAFLDDLNKGRPSICSVLSRGLYSAVVREGNPAPYPAIKPHYE